MTSLPWAPTPHDNPYVTPLHDPPPIKHFRDTHHNITPLNPPHDVTPPFNPPSNTPHDITTHFTPNDITTTKSPT